MAFSLRCSYASVCGVLLVAIGGGLLKTHASSSGDISGMLPALWEGDCTGLQAQLLLTTIVGMTNSSFCPFLRSSLANTASTSTLVIFTDDARKVMLLPRVKVITVSKTAPMVWHLWRYFLYARYLDFCMERLPPDSIQGVAISDSRDVFVLGDIWRSHAVQDAVLNNRVMLSLQGNPTSGGPGAPMPVRHRRTNMRWIRSCFPGAEKDGKLLDTPVSCSGVTIGGSKAMLKYAHKMADLLVHGADAKCWFTKGADQALHIMLLKMSMESSPDLDFRVTVLPNGESPVYSAVHGFPISVSLQGKVTVVRGFLRERRFSPMILHQYDRDEHISRIVRGLYNCSSGVRFAVLSWYWLGWTALQVFISLAV
ncbi:hypothetical protein DUNSADRAFT_2554 [Dunaliella salina]|uniref:Uncharacterized protein n=1 Tax=Dunaliella salina TaxID=3046 RepID=A0ABQ7GVG3_DUNSA|nr:hypothetical protein DUNSADRAFT_2554 [Dunaliella salina]|eukprot:KAF5838570.1 hypothetical protein DUNSADRAFT_2554 [Dunaliella salina]